MTVYDLTDAVRWRLEDISFFGVLLLASAVGLRFLWNFLARDFTRLPKLTWATAFCLTVLLGMAMLLVLVMISGARELLTPGAWQRQESHYRLNDIGNLQLRQKHFEVLRAALLKYAEAHSGAFPPNDYTPDISAHIWQAPDSAGTRYIYRSGVALGDKNALLAFEPQHFGRERFVLFGDGRVEKVTASQIQSLIRAQGDAAKPSAL